MLQGFPHSPRGFKQGQIFDKLRRGLAGGRGLVRKNAQVFLARTGCAFTKKVLRPYE